MHFFYAIINRLPPPDRCRKGGVLLIDDIFSFILSIFASIIAYYICKWLDRN